MQKLLLIDGNSIINRAFYGIMGSKMLMTEDGTYTNAVYGFLAILFKELEDIKPEYMVIAFDLKAPTHRHKMYAEYKANRKGMPDELAAQMPILKEVLEAMNITIIEKEGYEADDILGTLAKWGKKQNLAVTVLTGDRDSFQLIDENIKVRIPRTKMGKTETDDYDENKINEEYGIKPIQFIELKGLMGDNSDNIPGIPGVGEKTALELIKLYETVDGVYANTDKLKGKLQEKVINNKELAYLSKTLGTIDIDAPINENLDDFRIVDWDKKAVLEIFKKLRFNRYIERFNLQETASIDTSHKIELKHEKATTEQLNNELIEEIKENKEIYYYINTVEKQKFNIINKNISNIVIYSAKQNISYLIEDFMKLKEIFESSEILKCGYKQRQDYILLKQEGIEAKNLNFDIEIAGYLLNSNISKYTIEYLSNEYLSIDLSEYLQKNSDNNNQINLFDNLEKEDLSSYYYTFVIYKLHDILKAKLQESNCIELFDNIEMPLVPVLAEMQYQGIYVDKDELIKYGNELKVRIDELTKEIYDLAGEEFNINSTKQLGEILFEKLQLKALKKTKTGYSTDSDVLEKLQGKHPIIEKVLEYRQLVKLNSTYVEGLIPDINKYTNKIHSNFHQTVTATGRISSTEPNLQNIPTRFELGKKLRKVFKPEAENIFIDADYSQIELRVLAHISNDVNMIEAFKKDEDIHAQVASKVFNIPMEEVTKEIRSKAKAVNFGIVYGISEFGLGEQLGISRSEAKQYISQYLEKYEGIKKFMENIVVEAKEKGYVETLFKRRRYIPELNSNNYTVRQFGARVAMNTPIQGTAADIMKIAMINVFNKIKEKNLKSKLLLQVHDELLVETFPDEIEQVRDILKLEMENVIELKVPLKIELEEGINWYDAK